MTSIEDSAKRWSSRIHARVTAESRAFVKYGNPWLIGAITAGAVLAWQGLEYWSDVHEEATTGRRPPAILPQSSTQVLPSYFSENVQHGSSLPRTRPSDDTAHKADDLFRGRVRSAEAQGASLRLVGARGDRDCAATVWGRELPGLMRAAECTEAFRGLYRDAGRHINGSISVFNLKDRERVRLIIDALQGRPGIGFFYSLANGSSDSVASPLWAAGEGRGHFLFIHSVWRDRGVTPNNTVAQIPEDLAGASAALALTGLDIAQIIQKMRTKH